MQICTAIQVYLLFEKGENVNNLETEILFQFSAIVGFITYLMKLTFLLDAITGKYQNLCAYPLW